MSVQFEEDQFLSGNKNFSSQNTSASQNVYKMQSDSHTGMAGWFVKKGIVKSESSAQYILLGIIVLNALIVVILFKYFI